MAYSFRLEADCKVWNKVGVDLGYGFVKATNGKNEFVFPSVVGPARELIGSEFSMFASGLDNLSITVDDQTFFVGELAIRQSEAAARTLDVHRLNDPSSRILMLTALSLLTQWEEESFSVVTGVPSAFYAHATESWLRMFEGTYRLQFSDGNEVKEKRVRVERMRVVPQPLGTIYDVTLDQAGNVADVDLSQRMIGVVDVGFKTTDFAVTRGMEYIDRLSGSITTGLSTAYGVIADKVLGEYRIHRANHEMDEIVQRGQLRVAGQIQDIGHIRRDAFELVAERVLTQLESIWNYRDLDVILVTGGGGAALADLLVNRFGNARLVDDAQMANVRGYAKLAANLFKSSAMVTV